MARVCFGLFIFFIVLLSVWLETHKIWRRKWELVLFFWIIMLIVVWILAFLGCKKQIAEMVNRNETDLWLLCLLQMIWVLMCHRKIIGTLSSSTVAINLKETNCNCSGSNKEKTLQLLHATGNGKFHCSCVQSHSELRTCSN